MNKFIAIIVLLFGAYYIGTQKAQPQNFGASTPKESLQQTQVLVNQALDLAEKKFIKVEKKPDPGPITVCRCNGAKVITHGDGHQTPCQCSDRPGGCICVRLNPPLPKDDLMSIDPPPKKEPAPTPQVPAPTEPAPISPPIIPDAPLPITQPQYQVPQ